LPSLYLVDLEILSIALIFGSGPRDEGQKRNKTQAVIFVSAYLRNIQLKQQWTNGAFKSDENDKYSPQKIMLTGRSRMHDRKMVRRKANEGVKRYNFLKVHS
jgi:hypothetical protein